MQLEKPESGKVLSQINPETNITRIAPLRAPQFIQFGTLTPSQWQKYGVKIEKPYVRGGPTENTPYDEKLGALENGKFCMYEGCGLKNVGVCPCPGHPGYIELQVPILNPEYLDYVVSILRCVCLQCATSRVTKQEAEISGILAFRRASRLKAMEKRSAKIVMCPSSDCRSSLPHIDEKNGCIYKYFKEGKSSHKKVQLTTETILNIFLQISNETMQLLGFNDGLSRNPVFLQEVVQEHDVNSNLDDNSPIYNHPHAVRPESLLIVVLPVVSTNCRPWIMQESEKKDDDLTERYNSILKANALLKLDKETLGVKDVKNKGRKKSGKLSEQERKKIINNLQSYVWSLIDNRKKSGPGTTANGRTHKGLHDRIGGGKESQIQTNAGGKRSDFSARTVICAGGTMLRADEIGIPSIFAEKETVPERVVEWNREYLQNLLDNKKVNWVRRDGEMIDVKRITRGWTRPFILRIGDIAERHLRDGDPFLFNRQPTLRVESMQGVKAKIIPGKVYRVPLGVMRPYGADCDGDEMNSHHPQSVGARVECHTIMSVAQHMVSAQNNSAVMGAHQNALIGSYLLTNTWPLGSNVLDAYEEEILSVPNKDGVRGTITTVTKEQFMDLMVSADIELYEVMDLMKRAYEFYPEYICHNTGWVAGYTLSGSEKKFAAPTKKEAIEKRSVYIQKKNIKTNKTYEYEENHYSFYRRDRNGSIIVPAKIVMSVIFPAIYDFNKVTDVNPIFPEVKICKGILLPDSGPLCKKTIGPSRCGNLQDMWQYFSPSKAIDFLSRIQFLTDTFMPMHGFSMGISDCIAIHKEEVAKTLSDAQAACDMILKSNKSEEEKEREMNSELNKAMGMAPYLARKGMNKGERNNLVIMKKCGGKGQDVNNGQISGFVGQQNVDGKRIPLTVSSNSRCLPHFKPGDNSPEARGFIFHNYLEGLTHTEMYFHAAGGRTGVIATAVKTASKSAKRRKRTIIFCLLGCSL